MKRLWTVGMVAALFLAVAYVSGGDQLLKRLTTRAPSPSGEPTPSVAAEAVQPGGYQIITLEEIREGNIADIKSVIARAALTGTITQAQAEPTLLAIVDNIVRSDPEIDEITVYLYADPGSTDSAYDIGRATWRPAGGRINLTATIARTNDRSTYETVLEIVDGIDAYLAARSVNEVKFGLTVDQRRAYFRDVALADARAMRDADARINPSSDVMANIRLNNELQAQYREEVRLAHGVDASNVGAILFEGQQMNWPMR